MKIKTKFQLGVVGIIILTVITGFFLWNNQKQAQKYTGPVEKVSIGVVKEFSPLVLLAEKQGYFKENGLDVAIKGYETGPVIIKDLLEDRLDFGVVGEFAFVANSFNEQDIKIVCSVSKSDSTKVFGRTDHGIHNPSDLKGKTIGVSKKTSSDFFLNSFLILNKIPLAEVKIIDMPPAKLTEAFLAGNIDAAAPFSSDNFKIEKTLNERVVSWPAQNGQNTYTLLLSNGTFVRNNKDVAERFVRALAQSEEYFKKYNKDALSYLAQILNLKNEDLSTLYSQFQVEIALEQSLLLTLEGEARWSIDSKLTTTKIVPNYLKFIYFDALEAVKPEAVTIIH